MWGAGSGVAHLAPVAWTTLLDHTRQSSVVLSMTLMP